MNRPYFADKSSKITAVSDLVVFIVSLVLSLLIRAQFSGYRVYVTDIAVLGPTTVFFRFFFTTLFEHYSFGSRTYLARDYVPLFLHNLIPTGILLAFRFLSPVSFLRLPISVIFVEYVFTNFGMIFIRYVFAYWFQSKKSRNIRYRPRILIWCDPDKLKDKELMKSIRENDSFIVKGILTTNPMFWDTQHHGFRVFGDETVIPKILYSDDSISTVCILDPDTETRKKVKEIFDVAARYNLEVGIFKKNTISIIVLNELLYPLNYLNKC